MDWRHIHDLIPAGREAAIADDAVWYCWHAPRRQAMLDRFPRHRFGPIFAGDIRKRRIEGMKSSRWRWRRDEMFVRIDGARHCLWRAADHEGEVLESRVEPAQPRIVRSLAQDNQEAI